MGWSGIWIPYIPPRGESPIRRLFRASQPYFTPKRFARIQNIITSFVYTLKDSGYCVVGWPSGTKPIACAFKSRFPFRFESRFNQGLPCSVLDSRYSQGAFFIPSRFWNPHPSQWFCFEVSLDVLNNFKPLPWRDCSHSINTGCFLALIVLSHSSHC